MTDFLDGWLLTTLVLTTAIPTYVAVLCVHRRSTRIKLAVFSVVFFAYSGLGLATMPGGERYYWPYASFLLAVLVGTAVASGALARGKTADTASLSGGTRQWWSDDLAGKLAAAYVLATIGQILVAGTEADLLNPARVFLEANQGADIFTGRLARRASTAYTVLAYLKLFCLPFFFIELQRRLGRRWLLQLLTLISITFLQVTADQQWGRAALIRPFLIWLFILLLRRRITGRAFVGICAAIMFVLVPAFNAISDWRSGVRTGGADSLSTALAVFQNQEFVYPHNYPVAEAMSEGGIYASKFLLWLFTLPVPRALTGASFSVTRDFSEHILGLPYGSPGFYVLLPSWLGEGLIAFGTSNAWLWGLLVGIALGLIDRFASRSPALVTFDAFVTASLAVFLRGSSQEFLGQVVNSLWLLVGLLMLRTLTARRDDRARQSGGLAGSRPRARVSP